MEQCEIEISCRATEPGLPVFRARLRAAMAAMGWLSHWREELLEEGTKPVLKINGRKAWQAKNESLDGLSEEKLLSLLRSNAGSRLSLKRVLRTHLSFLSALVVAFFPKCPFCWAAYMSLLSGFGLDTLPYQPWLLPLFIVLLFLNIVSLYLSRKRHGYKPMALALAGAVTITLNSFYIESQALMIVGALFLITASLWNSLPAKMVVSLKYYFSKAISQ